MTTPMTLKRRARLALIAVSCASLLAACGGGGDDGDESAATAAAPGPSQTAHAGADARALATDTAGGVRLRAPQCDPLDTPPSCGATLPPTQ